MKRVRSRSRGGKGAGTSSGAAKITFTDDFTGADASAPNARWTGDTAGWEINTNHLRFTGVSYSFITTPYTAGNNTMAVNVDFSAIGATFGGVVVRYVNGSNYTTVTLNGSEELVVTEVVAATPTIILSDTGHTRLGAAGGGVLLSCAIVSNSLTVTVTGGTDPGSFGPVALTQHASAAAFGLAMNTGKSSDWFDNCVLS